MPYSITKNARPKRLLARIAIDRKKVEAEFDRVYDEEKEKRLSNGASEKVALHVAAQKACGVVDRYWREVLPRFGYDYIKRKDGYEYGR